MGSKYTEVHINHITTIKTHISSKMTNGPIMDKMENWDDLWELWELE